MACRHVFYVEGKTQISVMSCPSTQANVQSNIEQGQQMLVSVNQHHLWNGELDVPRQEEFLFSYSLGLLFDGLAILFFSYCISAVIT